MNTHSIQIAAATLSDVEALRQISIQTFQDTYAAFNTEANMQEYIQRHFSAETLSEELQNPNIRFYFARGPEAEIRGYIRLNFVPMQTELNDPSSLELERIYVLSAYKGRQIGQALMAHAREVGKQLGLKYIWLGVWEKNEAAIAFYRKIGFAEFARHVFVLGDDEQMDYLMKQDIQ